MSENDGAVDRRSEIAANLEAVRRRIANACAAAGRSPDEITLVAITKTYPASDVIHLAALGVRDVGENKDQDAAPKAAEVRTAGVDVRWHFVGQLQRNKARSVAAYAAMVHSVDRIPLVTALEKAADERTEPLEVLIQVSLDADPGDRGGTPTDQVGQLAAAIAAAQSLRLRGVMAVAPLDGPPGPAFARLSEVAATLRSDHPNATVISAGMSGDFEVAIDYGATHVRLGTSLLGNRPRLL